VETCVVVTVKDIGDLSQERDAISAIPPQVGNSHDHVPFHTAELMERQGFAGRTLDAPDLRRVLAWRGALRSSDEIPGVSRRAQRYLPVRIRRLANRGTPDPGARGRSSWCWTSAMPGPRALAFRFRCSRTMPERRRAALTPTRTRVGRRFAREARRANSAIRSSPAFHSTTIRAPLAPGVARTRSPT